MKIRNQPTITSAKGFSLLEVMIAVLVLAVGLLALVALQSTLVREGAESKARSRIAALVASRLDEARAGGYESLTAVAAAGCASGNAVCVAQDEAAVTNLTVGQAVTTTTAAGATWEYKTVTVSANWKSTAGEARKLEMSTRVSPLSLDTSSTLLDQQLSGDIAKSPIVRTDNPATAGVVPIALGNGSSSAASNPTPELVGQKNNEAIVATRFDVLTYVPGSGSATIQKRIETEVVKCTCQYGAGGANLSEIYRTAQWPAIWTGEKYELYASTAAAPGQLFSSGPKSGVTQSALCTECCRDHHDSGATTVAKFDPERSGGVSKYYRDTQGNLTEQTNAVSGEYVNACRLVRVDGLWRTAADMYARNLGLLETTPLLTVKAKSGLPTTAATTAYATFVKSYLAQYTGTSGAAPSNAQSIFDATTGLNTPTILDILTPSNSDYRYLHARGLYVDYLEAKARAKLVSVLADTGVGGKCPSGTTKSDCVMPYLPFISANLTEIAKWASSDTTTLVVNTDGTLATNPSQPSGGRSVGRKAGNATNTATARASNSGIAINTAAAFTGVDPADVTGTLSDAQAFSIGGTTGQTSGDDFYVGISGGGTNPNVFYTVAADTGECFKETDGRRHCTTASRAPFSGTLKVQNFWAESTTSKTFTIASGQCTVNGNGNASYVSQNFTLTTFPVFQNYGLTSALVAGTTTQLSKTQGGTDGTVSEAYTVNYASLPDNGQINLVFALENTRTDATIKTCTVTYSNKAKAWSLSVSEWNKPWQ